MMPITKQPQPKLRGAHLASTQLIKKLDGVIENKLHDINRQTRYLFCGAPTFFSQSCFLMEKDTTTGNTKYVYDGLRLQFEVNDIKSPTDSVVFVDDFAKQMLLFETQDSLSMECDFGYIGSDTQSRTFSNHHLTLSVTACSRGFPDQTFQKIGGELKAQETWRTLDYANNMFFYIIGIFSVGLFCRKFSRNVDTLYRASLAHPNSQLRIGGNGDVHVMPPSVVELGRSENPLIRTNLVRESRQSHGSQEGADEESHLLPHLA
jgi:hypothetical protein